jgi:carboxypeptidase family protein
MRLITLALLIVTSACVVHRRAPMIDNSHGAVAGVVTDSTGRLLWGTQVRAFALQGPDSGKVVATTSTPESGAFLLPRLPEGLYDIQFRAICHEPTRRRLRLVSQRVDTLRVTLQLAPPNICVPE